MKTAIYPGSFNPWHEGHTDVVSKAIKVFDKVIIAVGVNPDKKKSTETLHLIKRIGWILVMLPESPRIEVVQFNGLLKDFIKEGDYSAVIKGLRNAPDFEYEKIQQYWNEDLGIRIPTFYVISDRKFVHISSSAIKAIKSFEKK